MLGGVSLEQIRNRKDRAKNGHTCTFESPSGLARGQRRLDDVRPAPQSPRVDHLEEMLAVFIAKANLSVNAVAQADLHGLLLSVFKAGWSAAMSTKETQLCHSFEAAAKMVPSCNRARLSSALQFVNIRERQLD
jgi:hypothetical protein